MTHKDQNIISFIVCCVSNFAEKYNLGQSQAYAYLNRFNGVDFLLSCYDAEHTLSIEDAIDDLKIICNRNGGRIL